ncbi:MAG: hypothetical protein JXA93_06840 [Anaerolineae bacterium]|nr:hypothetical protein [Anaerolineae bacterium]
MSTDGDLQELSGGQPDQPGTGPEQAAGEPATRFGGGLGDLLGAVLGSDVGGEVAEEGGLVGLLGAVFGGNASSEQAEPAGLGALLGGSVASLIERLVGGLGLEPETAQVAVALVLDKLLGARRGEAASAEADDAAAIDTAPGIDLRAVLALLGSDQAVDAEALRGSGLVGELAEKAGLDADMAAEVVLQILALLAGKEPAKPRKKRKTTKKTTAKKKATTKKSTARKKPAAKKGTTKKKPAAKKTTAKKKPAAKKPATPKSTTKKKPAAKKKSTSKKASG